VNDFQIVGQINEIEVIAVGSSIREIERLRKSYGVGRWRKLKGIATVILADDTMCGVEVHLYEARGIGRKEIKIKRFLNNWL